MTASSEPVLAARVRGLGSSAIRDLLALTTRAGVLSMAGGLPAEEALPARHLAHLAEQILRDRPAAALQYGPTEGVADLRAWVADAEASLVGATVDADRVLITSGSQQALALVAQAVVEPGACVVVENPGYVGGLQALSAAGAHLVPVPVDGGGLAVDALHQQLRLGLRPAAVYTVATFQNPAGAVAGHERRAALAALADHYGFLVIDDDPYRDLWFAEEPPRPLTAYTERAVHLGSASKVLAPGLRVGWAMTPAWLHGPLVRLKQSADLQPPSLGQALVLAAVTDQQWFSHHVSGLRALYAERAKALVAAAGEVFGTTLALQVPAGGMFSWARFTDGTCARDLLAVALRHGVAFVPGEEFATGPADPCSLRLSFATLSPERLREAVSRLGEAHRELHRPVGRPAAAQPAGEVPVPSVG